MKKKSEKAIALKYDKDKDDAPKVIAKGKNLIAKKIKAIATEHNIYIKKDKYLAEELYELNLNEEIPEELYEAIAKILLFVYNL